MYMNGYSDVPHPYQNNSYTHTPARLVLKPNNRPNYKLQVSFTTNILIVIKPDKRQIAKQHALKAIMHRKLSYESALNAKRHRYSHSLIPF